MTLSFHNDASLKSALVAQGEAHLAADLVAHNGYGKGRGSIAPACTIGCYARDLYDGRDLSSAREQFAAKYAIPLRFTGIVDAIFEQLPQTGVPREDFEWHRQWTSAIPVGAPIAALETVCDKMILFATKKKAESYGAPRNRHLLMMSALYERRIAGNEPSEDEWALAARYAWDALDALAARYAWDALDALAARYAWASWAALDALDALAALAALDARAAYSRACRDEYLRLMENV